MHRLVALQILAALAFGALAPGTSAQAISARLQGTFAMNGRVTTAVHIKGEHVGDAVARTWTFTPLCPAGECARVSLTRTRAGGSDTLILDLRGSGGYAGTGHFYAPLGCANHVHPHGLLVPFTITVGISATAQSSSGPIASTITATYVNPKRMNLTKCVALPSHDAAVYTGSLQSGAQPGAVRSRSPAGS